MTEGKNEIPVAVLEKYSAVKDNRDKKFVLFKQYIEDPTCLSVYVEENTRR